jgi:hypothetical protein
LPGLTLLSGVPLLATRRYCQVGRYCRGAKMAGRVVCSDVQVPSTDVVNGDCCRLSDHYSRIECSWQRSEENERKERKKILQAIRLCRLLAHLPWLRSSRKSMRDPSSGSVIRNAAGRLSVSPTNQTPAFCAVCQSDS